MSDTKVRVLDLGWVELQDVMGDDLAIVYVAGYADGLDFAQGLYRAALIDDKAARNENPGS